jgi:hypothetical protein
MGVGVGVGLGVAVGVGVAEGAGVGCPGITRGEITHPLSAATKDTRRMMEIKKLFRRTIPPFDPIESFCSS